MTFTLLKVSNSTFKNRCNSEKVRNLKQALSSPSPRRQETHSTVEIRISILLPRLELKKPRISNHTHKYKVVKVGVRPSLAASFTGHCPTSVIV